MVYEISVNFPPEQAETHDRERREQDKNRSVESRHQLWYVAKSFEPACDRNNARRHYQRKIGGVKVPNAFTIDYCE